MTLQQALLPWLVGAIAVGALGCGEANGGEPTAGLGQGGSVSTSGAGSDGAGAPSGTTGGTTVAGGTSSVSGASQGGASTAGSSAASGASALGGTSASGGTEATAGGSSGSGGGNSNPGTCTVSKATGANVTGSGPYKVTVETNSDAGIKEGTIFRPAELTAVEKFPIFVWGEGGCSQDGMSNSAAMAEIASHGYFVVADGTPKGTTNRPLTSDFVAMGKPLLAYVDWAIAENGKPCSAYFQKLDASKVSSNGFSCGGLMAEGTAGDPRITTWALNSSGQMSANQAFYKTVKTPVLMVQGGPSDIAYENGLRDYDNLSAAGIPILLFSKDIGHGGDLFSARGGDFTKINLAWLNWQLKGDLGSTGKGLLVGAGCNYCSNSAWEVKSANIQ